eukprot:CAMPEP_0184391700 /NCGR_PEP_ID=MMETSP0007-20130409/15142_1 /TAXON_ID=97485 /ORGANISM="Prymnesium parvum, Strain Texoma1" /LENGTH=38 /DNA_ID= /DNA_START= /DNA_END= /DNA_ORIENTATION=
MGHALTNPMVLPLAPFGLVSSWIMLSAQRRSDSAQKIS